MLFFSLGKRQHPTPQLFSHRCYWHLLLWLSAAVAVHARHLRQLGSGQNHQPSNQNEEHLIDARIIGNHGIKNLGECQGDCDSDDDCSGDMICHHGHHPPGCRLDWHHRAGSMDFCVRNVTQTEIVTNHHHYDDNNHNATTLSNHTESSSSSAPFLQLGLCQGNCAKHTDCAGSLLCHTDRASAPPGCWEHHPGHDETANYCVSPPTDVFCQGGCETDADCGVDGLICHQRGRGRRVPGCHVPDDASDLPNTLCIKDTTPCDAKHVTFDGNRANLTNLGLCHGDCDSNSDCQEGLVCYQRSVGQGILGCQLTEREMAQGHDYCVKDPYFVGFTDSHLESFRIKLFWEKGAYWQEENFERKWCMHCERDCEEGSEIIILPCSGRLTEWVFAPVKRRTIQIKIRNRDLCMETTQHDPNDLALARCNAEEPRQHFRSDGYQRRRFEISPLDRPESCLTQRHHPKSHERVQIEPCSTAKKSYTNYWNADW